MNIYNIPMSELTGFLIMTVLAIVAFRLVKDIVDNKKKKKDAEK